MTATSYKGAKLSRPLVLAIDLDPTFPQSDPEARADLFALFEAHLDDVRLVYMSNGSADQLIQLAADAELPVPEVFMADAGTTVLKGDGSGAIEPLQRNIIQLWPGNDAVENAIKEIEGLELQPDGALCRETVKANSAEALEALREKAQQLGCHLERCGEDLYFVFPYGVEKGTTLGRFLVEANINPNNVLSIGEVIGDMCLFGRGWRGAVFAHAPAELREDASRFHNVVILEHSGAEGVLEALRAHGWLEMAAQAS